MENYGPIILEKENKFVIYILIIKRSLILFSLFLLFYFIMSFALVYVAKSEKKRLDTFFFERSPDVIMVFTGDKGRIPLAFDFALKHDNAKIFITGVHAKNTVTGLLKQKVHEGIKEKLDSNQMIIDYLARNTLENVIAAYRYLHRNKNMKKIVLISHDYHILRMRSIIERMRGEQDDFEFFYLPVQPDYSKWKNLRVLLKEVVKMIRTYIFLVFWDPVDIQISNAKDF